MGHVEGRSFVVGFMAVIRRRNVMVVFVRIMVWERGAMVAWTAMMGRFIVGEVGRGMMWWWRWRRWTTEYGRRFMILVFFVVKVRWWWR